MNMMHWNRLQWTVLLSYSSVKHKVLLQQIISKSETYQIWGCQGVSICEKNPAHERAMSPMGWQWVCGMFRFLQTKHAG